MSYAQQLRKFISSPTKRNNSAQVTSNVASPAIIPTIIRNHQHISLLQSIRGSTRMEISQISSSDIMRINDLHKDDEIVFRGRRASRIPIIIVTDYSFLRGEFDKMSYDPATDDDKSDVSMDRQSKEKDSRPSSSPTSIYSLVASSEGGVPVSSSTVRSDSLSASYRQLVSPMTSSKASTIEGTSSGYSGSDNGSASTRSAAKLADMCHTDIVAAHSMTWHDSNRSQQGDTRSKDRKSQEDHTDGDCHGRVLLLIVEDYFGTPASLQVGLNERIRMWMIDAAAGLDALPHYAIIDPETLESCSK